MSERTIRRALARIGMVTVVAVIAGGTGVLAAPAGRAYASGTGPHLDLRRDRGGG
jgi:cell division GTPase FtsZ